MSRYAIQMNDGSVAIMETIGDNVDPADEVARWPAKEAAKVVSWVEIGPADVPQDRAFRNAWKLEGKAIVHDMDKARTAQAAAIRRRRDAGLRRKDAEWLVAYSRGDMGGAAAVEAERQSLRDIPQKIDADLKAAKTIDALKSVWPAGLK
jgi:hypothetical protein